MSEIEVLRRELIKMRDRCYDLQDRVIDLEDMVDELYGRAVEGELRLASEQSMIMRRALGRLDA